MMSLTFEDEPPKCQGNDKQKSELVDENKLELLELKTDGFARFFQSRSQLKYTFILSSEHSSSSLVPCDLIPKDPTSFEMFQTNQSSHSC
jgi:hypothetical protein